MVDGGNERASSARKNRGESYGRMGISLIIRSPLDAF